MLVGIVSGIISGFIVSVVLWGWNVLRRDSLELRFVAPNRAFLRNNRLRTVVIGGSWEIEKGATIYRGDDFCGEDHGLVIQPFETLPVRTHMLQPGQPTMVSVKQLPIRLGKLPDSELREWERAKIDPAVYVARENDMPKDWKLKSIFLQA